MSAAAPSAFAENASPLPEPAEEPELDAEEVPAVELALQLLGDIAESRLVCASARVAARRFLHRLELAAREQVAQELMKGRAEAAVRAHPDLSSEEIALRLGCGETTVREARRRLRDAGEIGKVPRKRKLSRPAICAGRNSQTREDLKFA